jgi:hypothetical protein
MMSEKPTTPSPAELRDELQAAVLADLLGPAGGPEEIVTEPYVRDRYLVGMLAPKGQTALPEELDDMAQAGMDGEDGVTEAPPPKAAAMRASSIGITFAVASTATAIRIAARWGRYERATVEEEQYRTKSGSFRRVWRRVPVEGVSGPIELRGGRLPDWAPCPDQPHVLVQGLARKRPEQWIVTLFLVNAQPEPKQLIDTAWLFQPELVVTSADGAPIFEKRPLPRQRLDPEELAMQMLYRHRVEFAVGHGVSVHADLYREQGNVAEECTDKAVRLATVVAPTYELPTTYLPTEKDYPELAGLTLDMHALSEIPDAQFGANLLPLISAYEQWIARLERRLQPIEPDLVPYAASAQDAVEKCAWACERIRAGITVLDASPIAAKAFRFANQAMHWQRVRSLYAADVRQGKAQELEHYDTPGNRSWRLFQLAFVLMNLPSLTDVTHPERATPSDRAPNPADAIADLLWFPTGGGKTEAYLGIAAYAMGIRRLQGVIGGRSGHAGVAVLMRYTLRLLTLQQFQRATALLCACEIIRREAPALWGSEPFRIGLWVGRRSTPNWTRDADEAVKSMRRSHISSADSTPHQLTNCPWCGQKIEPGRDIGVELYPNGRGRTLIYCGDPLGACPFSRKRSPDEGLPAVVVDEEIYRRLPSLLIATVDKFAQMPWNGRVAMLFGQVDGYCERHGYRSPELEDSDSHPKRGLLPAARTLHVGPLRPPDLIIQDELHLISGPLGTLVGLYETAVDGLASWEVNGLRVRPKVIASTATIRRADTQVHNVFLRHVSVFPPYGLDAEDNFFSLQRPPDEEHPGRRYLGLCAPGTRQRAALIHTYVAFLAAAQRLYERCGAESDPWMTLVGYFNSLRQLGGMRRAIDDSVSSRLQQTGDWGLSRRFLSPYSVQELTSRLSATDIPDVLDRLETPFNEDTRPSTAKKGQRREGPWPIDVLLATNMISVGVDVSRLGLMVVDGQPKTTAEYIQATSRVGRRHPGLVATIYNWARPRDLSHYERFEHYHATFYQYVEALSVTPFSPRAVDRALSGVLVSLVRLLGLELNDDAAAQRLVRDHPYLVRAVEQIATRAGQVRGHEAESLVREKMEERKDTWLHRISDLVAPAHLRYRRGTDGLTLGLLSDPGTGAWEEFTCLNSLRDVEPSVNLILDNYGMDRASPQPWAFAQKESEIEAPVEGEA